MPVEMERYEAEKAEPYFSRTDHFWLYAAETGMCSENEGGGDEREKTATAGRRS